MKEKSKITKKEENSLPVYEAEVIDDDVERIEKSDISQREKKLPLAYTIGRISGYLGSFLFGLIKSKNIFFKSDGIGGGGRGRRVRGKRRRKGKNF